MIVSVVIPTYCRSSLLCEAIDSVLSQNIDGLELLVVDDGSTDDTREKVQEYGDKVSYIYQENKGLGTARNVGFSLAKGEYVALLDDDDWWMPGKLELQIALLEKLPDVCGVFTNFSIFRAPDEIRSDGIRTWFDETVDLSTYLGSPQKLNEVLGHCHGSAPDTNVYLSSIYEQSLDQYFVLPSTSLIRRQSIPENLHFPTHDPICGDWEFFARLSRDSKLCFVDADTTFNRSHNDSVRLTRTKMIRQVALRIDFLERVYVTDLEYYSANRPQVDATLLGRLVELCKLQILESDLVSARKTADKARRIQVNKTPKQRLVLSAAAVPGIDYAARQLRKLKRML